MTSTKSFQAWEYQKEQRDTGTVSASEPGSRRRPVRATEARRRVYPAPALLEGARMQATEGIEHQR